LKKEKDSVLGSNDMTLVVGDVHISQGQNLRRAKWLGAAIEDIRPNRVLFIGDFLTFDALSAWDKNKRAKMEGRRYQKDIDAGNKFLGAMYSEMSDVALMDTQFILTEGNHEERLWRYLDEDPTFKGAVDYRVDLDIEDWTIVPYKEYYIHRGIHFTHVPFNKARPIGGKYAVHRALEFHQHSVIFGHTHELSSAGLHRTGAAHLSQSLSVGCYFEHTDDYAVGTVTNYWRGILLIDHYKLGRFGWQPLSMGKMRRYYNAKRK